MFCDLFCESFRNLSVGGSYTDRAVQNTDRRLRKYSKMDCLVLYLIRLRVAVPEATNRRKQRSQCILMHTPMCDSAPLVCVGLLKPDWSVSKISVGSERERAVSAYSTTSAAAEYSIIYPLDCVGCWLLCALMDFAIRVVEALKVVNWNSSAFNNVHFNF